MPADHFLYPSQCGPEKHRREQGNIHFTNTYKSLQSKTWPFITQGCLKVFCIGPSLCLPLLESLSLSVLHPLILFHPFQPWPHTYTCLNLCLHALTCEVLHVYFYSGDFYLSVHCRGSTWTSSAVGGFKIAYLLPPPLLHQKETHSSAVNIGFWVTGRKEEVICAWGEGYAHVTNKKTQTLSLLMTVVCIM